MVCSRQEDYSLIKHSLISVYGKQWRKRLLGMFTTFIDDSGTAPEQKVLVACGIVVPTARLGRLESEWNSFKEKEGIPDFHASVCLARNQHSPFATWNDETVRRVFAQIRQFTIRFSVHGFCIGIYKKDYDEVLTADLKAAVGDSYFTWALSSVLGLALDFADSQKAPMHFVFDHADKVLRREIIDGLEFSETIYPNRIAGHWNFGKRVDVPALQAVDLFAWSCFQQFKRARLNQSIHAIAEETDKGFADGRNGKWRIVQSLNRQGIEKWVTENRDNPRTKEIIAFKEKLKEARKPKPKKGGPAK